METNDAVVSTENPQTPANETPVRNTCGPSNISSMAPPNNTPDPRSPAHDINHSTSPVIQPAPRVIEEVQNETQTESDDDDDYYDDDDDDDNHDGSNSVASTENQRTPAVWNNEDPLDLSIRVPPPPSPLPPVLLALLASVRRHLAEVIEVGERNELPINNTPMLSFVRQNEILSTVTIALSRPVMLAYKKFMDECHNTIRNTLIRLYREHLEDADVVIRRILSSQGHMLKVFVPRNTRPDPTSIQPPDLATFQENEEYGTLPESQHQPLDEENENLPAAETSTSNTGVSSPLNLDSSLSANIIPHSFSPVQPEPQANQEEQNDTQLKRNHVVAFQGNHLQTPADINTSEGYKKFFRVEGTEANPILVLIDSPPTSPPTSPAAPEETQMETNDAVASTENPQIPANETAVRNICGPSNISSMAPPNNTPDPRSPAHDINHSTSSVAPRVNEEVQNGTLSHTVDYAVHSNVGFTMSCWKSVRIRIKETQTESDVKDDDGSDAVASTGNQRTPAVWDDEDPLDLSIRVPPPLPPPQLATVRRDRAEVIEEGERNEMLSSVIETLSRPVMYDYMKYMYESDCIIKNLLIDQYREHLEAADVIIEYIINRQRYFREVVLPRNTRRDPTSIQPPDLATFQENEEYGTLPESQHQPLDEEDENLPANENPVTAPLYGNMDPNSAPNIMHNLPLPEDIIQHPTSSGTLPESQNLVDENLPAYPRYNLVAVPKSQPPIFIRNENPVTAPLYEIIDPSSALNFLNDVPSPADIMQDPTSSEN